MTPASAVRGAAGWFDALVLVAATALASSGLASLGLAVAGRWSGPVVLVLAVALWALALFGLRGVLSACLARPATRSTHLASVLVLVLAAAAVAWYGYQPSQHLLVERDPGAYVTTSLWIEREGSLVDPDVLAIGEGEPGIVAGSPGSYLTEDGLEFQFNHFTASVGAVAASLGGHRALFRVTGWAAVLGLLATYAVAARLTRRPWLAALVPVVLGASLPVVVLARDMYSEPFLLALIWPVVLLADEVWRRPGRGAATVLGALVGTLLTVRVESLLYLTALSVLLVLVRPAAGGRAWRRALPWFVLGAVPTVALGAVDFVEFTGGYTEVVGSEVRTAVALLVAAVVTALVLRRLWDRHGGLRSALDRRRELLAGLAAGATAVVLIGLWLVRPLLPPDRLDVQRWGVLGAIQAREGDPVDPFRSYYELSVRWIEWYVGPIVVAAGIAGLALMVHRLVRGRLDPVGWVTLALFGTGGLAYLVAPGINPDQLWATRRLVPVALVVVVLGAVVLAGSVMDRWAPAGAPRAAVGVLTALVMVAPTFRATAPLALVSEQPAMWGALGAVCADVGPQGAVLVVGVPARDLLPMALRARCDVTVAELDTGDVDLAVERVRRVADRLAPEDRTLTLVAMDRADLAPFEAAGLGDTRRSATAGNPREHEHTLNRAPRRYLRGDETFFLPREIVIWALPVGPE